MRTLYRVEAICTINRTRYQVIQTIVIPGERLNAYESEVDTKTSKGVFIGSLSDCEAYINLKEKGYM